jgi:tetratricopeptide (TPR) repeat protein
VPAPRRIRLLGRPHAGGVQLRGNKPWAITAYLALADAPVPRARIISLLFDSAQDPAAALRWNLGQARRLLGRGDIDAAIAVFRHGLNADPGREHAFLPIMLSHAGRAGLLAGDFPAACGHLDQALQIAQTRPWAGVTAAPLALLGHVAVATGDLVTARDLLEEALARACQVGDPCWETWAAHGLGLHAAASGNPSAALHHLADAVARSHPTRGGHLWSHVWALTDAARLGRRLGDTRHVAWQEEALATAQRCGMRALAGQLQAPLHDARRGA